MFKSPQSGNNEPRPAIPGALERFYANPMAGEALIAHVVYAMESTQRIPHALTPIVERPLAVPAEPAPAATVQPDDTTATITPITEGSQARMRREATELINDIHNPAQVPQITDELMEGAA